MLIYIFVVIVVVFYYPGVACKAIVNKTTCLGKLQRWCKACNKYMDASNFSTHVKSAVHKASAAQKEPAAPAEDFVLRRRAEEQVMEIVFIETPCTTSIGQVFMAWGNTFPGIQCTFMRCRNANELWECIEEVDSVFADVEMDCFIVIYGRGIGSTILFDEDEAVEFTHVVETMLRYKNIRKHLGLFILLISLSLYYVLIFPCVCVCVVEIYIMC